MTIAARIAQIRQNLPDTVKLIAVSKQVSVEAMRVAYAAGIRDFGESRVQEAEAKQEQLTDLTDITWHFIGRLQSNKAKKALELFQWIHADWREQKYTFPYTLLMTVDRISTASNKVYGSLGLIGI